VAVRTRPLKEVVDVCAKKNMCDASIYFVANAEAQARQLAGLARQRHMVVTDAELQSLTARDVLPEWERVHLDGYERIWKDRVKTHRLAATAEFVVDARQNPFEHEVCSHHMMTLTQNARRYSFKHNRCLLGVEAFGSLNVALRPLLDDIQKHFEAVGLEFEAQRAQDCWTAPENLATLSEPMAMRLAGNGFSLVCGGAVAAWTFATCVHIVDGVDLLPSPSSTLEWHDQDVDVSETDATYEDDGDPQPLDSDYAPVPLPIKKRRES
jgi:hypothetical protein